MTPGRHRAPLLFRDERGFTMTEVIGTIVVMSIVLAIAASTWQNVIESRRVDSATNQLVADMRLAHTSATNQLTSWRVVYNASGAPVTGCGAAPADYCLIKMSGSTVAESQPRDLPEKTELQTDMPVISPLPGFAYDRSLEFRSDGTARTTAALLPSPSSPYIRVRTEGDANNEGPNHIIRFNLVTSRVQVDP